MAWWISELFVLGYVNDKQLWYESTLISKHMLSIIWTTFYIIMLCVCGCIKIVIYICVMQFKSFNVLTHDHFCHCTWCLFIHFNSNMHSFLFFWSDSNLAVAIAAGCSNKSIISDYVWCVVFLFVIDSNNLFYFIYFKLLHSYSY